MGTLTTVVNDEFIEAIDKMIKNSKLYSSRSEFLKDAIREKLLQVELVTDEKQRSRFLTRKFALGALENGWDGNLISREEKQKAFLKFAKKKGFKV